MRTIGSSGSVPGPGNPASAYLISTAVDGVDHHLLLDCGPGSYGELQRHLDPRELTAVGLSHLHPDHCLDLCALHVAARHSPTSPWPRLPVYGPEGTRRRITAAYQVPGAEPADLTASFDVRPWADEQAIGPWFVRTAPVVHPVPCVAIRVEAAGRTVVYSGDTGESEALVELARGADLLLCEAGSGVRDDAPPGVHLTADQAVDHAGRAGVGRLLLTHIAPWDDPDVVLAAARHRAESTGFDGKIAVATPGLEVVL